VSNKLEYFPYSLTRS